LKDPRSEFAEAESSAHLTVTAFSRTADDDVGIMAQVVFDVRTAFVIETDRATPYDKPTVPSVT